MKNRYIIGGCSYNAGQITGLRIYLLVIMAICASVGTKAQLSLTNVAPSATINFSNNVLNMPTTVGTNTATSYAGAGFSPNPTNAGGPGRLNSNAWSVVGWSDPDVNYGGTNTAGDLARGATAAPVITGGFYAYTGAPGSAANPTFMIQPGGSDFAPGTITLKIVNKGTTIITDIAVSYNIYVRNDQARGNSFNFSYSANNILYTDATLLNYTSTAAPDALGWVLAGNKSTTITGLNLVPDSLYYLRWSSNDVSGSGSRDELGLDDININATFGGACTPPGTQASFSGPAFSNIFATQMDVNFTRGNGTGGIIIVASTSATLSSTPVIGNTYIANSNYGNGDPIGGGYTVFNGVANGTGLPATFTATGLSGSTTYYFHLFEYDTGPNCYLTPTVTNSQATLPGSGTSSTDYFESVQSGPWSTLSTWRSSPDNSTWIVATLTPTFLAKNILIRSPHVVTITSSTTAKMLNIAVGATLDYSNGASGGYALDIAADPTGVDFKIFGTYKIYGIEPGFNAGATGEVYNGGLVQVRGNTTGGSDNFARSPSMSFFTGAVFDWNIVTAFQTSGVVYFPNASPTDIAIFRISANVGSVGATNPTTINGLFEVSGNISFINSGTKIFRNGIIGDLGTLTQGSTGLFSIDGVTAVIGGTGVINLFAGGGLTIAPSSVTTLISNKTINTGTATFTVDGTLMCSTFIVSGTSAFTLSAAGTIGLGSPDGISSFGATGNIQTTGTRTLSVAGNFIYNGNVNQVTGTGLSSPNTGFLTVSNSGAAGSNTVTLTNNNTVVDSLNLDNGLFEAGTGQFLQVSANGVVARTGTGGNQGQSAAAGTIWFSAGGAGSGTIKPGAGLSLTNVRISGGVNMGAGNTSIKGTLMISSGGFVNASTAPTYSSTPPSTLIYNTGGGYGIGNEWYDNTFGANPGVPHHVTVTGSTAVTLAGTSFPREMRGDMLIGSGSFALTGGFGCDLYIKGNWTRSAGTTFTPNTRAVKFNGSAAQTVTRTGGGTETFSYLLIDKPAGVAVVHASAPDATNITVSGVGGNSLQLISGDLDLNRQTFNFTSYISSQNNIGIDGISPNLTRSIISSGGTGIFLVFNAQLVNHYVTVNRINGANASLLLFGSTVTVKTGAAPAVGGGGGIDFGSNLTTINGTLQLNNYGYVTNLSSGGQGPFYGNSSLLMYKSIGLFDRNVEWGNTSGAGYPWHVSVDSATILNLNTAANGSADRALAGDLTIFNGSTLVLATNAAANTLTVGRDVFINGTLTLPANFGADIHVVRNWNRGTTGVFNPNDRAVFLDGSGSATITANNNGQLFPYLYIKKNSALDIVSLLDSISITKEFAISTNGKFELNDKNARLISNATGTASFGKMGAGADVTYSAGGRFIVERFIPVGILAGQHLKSWQHLATPSNGGQTINAAWQEGAAVPNQDLRPGNGTSITSNILPTPAMFDTFSVGGPSMKSYNPLTALWDGVPNTTGTPLFNQKGYLLFVRGDRSVNSFFAPNNVAKATNLRNTGKLFVPGSNPPPSTTVLAGKFASIGNPYASSIDFLSFVSPALDSVLYLWDPLLYGSYGLGGWQTMSETNLYKPSPGTGGNTIYDPTVPYTKIQSGQAFMVYGSSAGGTVSFTENAKIAGSNLVFRPVNADRPGRKFMRVTLYAANGQVADGNVVAFDPSFSNAFESKDAVKIQNQGENFGILSKGKILAVEARSPVLRTDTIQYGFSRLRVQAYQLRFGPENFSNPRLKAFLIDKWLHSRTPVSLDDTTYININITPDPASSAVNRFMLVFIRKGVVGGTPGEGLIASGKAAKVTNKNSLPERISVYPNPVTDGQLHLSFKNKAAGNYKIQLLNAAGQLAHEQSMELETTNSERTLKLGDLPAGLYQLAIHESSGVKTTQPLIIQ